MRKVTFILIISAFANLLGAQELTYEQVGALTDERTVAILQTTDSVLVYEPGCNGCYWIGQDECNCQRTNYLIWTQNSSCKIQKIDCCGVHELGELDIKIWNSFVASSKPILKSEFRAEYSINHYFFENLNFVTRGSSTQIEIRDYYFSNSVADSTWNMSVPAKIFVNELSNAVTKWEKAN